MLGILRTTVLGIVGTALLCKAASACTVQGRLDLNDIELADVVVTGSIKNYQALVDTKARKRRDLMLADYPSLRKRIEVHEALMVNLGDYARFDIEVDEVLLGSVEPGLVPAVWINATYPVPEKYPSGPFLIALRAMPPRKGEIAETLRAKSDSWHVLQPGCASPFIFGITGRKSAEVRNCLLYTSPSPRDRG